MLIQKLRRSFCTERELLGYLLIFKTETYVERVCLYVVSILFCVKSIFRLILALGF